MSFPPGTCSQPASFDDFFLGPFSCLVTFMSSAFSAWLEILTFAIHLLWSLFMAAGLSDRAEFTSVTVPDTGDTISPAHLADFYIAA